MAGDLELMEPRIQYAKTEDGVSIAYYTIGEGTPMVVMPGARWAMLNWSGNRGRSETSTQHSQKVDPSCGTMNDARIPCPASF